MDRMLFEEKMEPIEELEGRGSLPFEGNMLPRGSMNM